MKIISFILGISNKLFLVFIEFISVKGRDWKKINYNDMENKKILIIRHGGIGDILFISPFLKKIKTMSYSSHITFMTRKSYHDVTKSIHQIDKTINHSWPNIISLFTSDYILFLDKSIEIDHDATNKNVYDLLSEKYFKIKLNNLEKHPIILATPDHDKYIQELLSQWHGHTIIGIQLLAGSPIRTPSKVFWEKIIDSILKVHPKALVMLIAVRQQAELCNNIKNDVLEKHPNAQILNFAIYSRNLYDLISLVNMIDLVIAPDSSVIHIAAAFETPAIGIYGPFPSALRTRYYRNNISVDATTVCAPCFTHGHRACKKNPNDKHSSSCFESIKPEQIIEATNFLLQKKHNSYYAYLNCGYSATSETSKLRKYIINVIKETANIDLRLTTGIDVGCGGDPIVPESICIDLPHPYTKCGFAPIHIKGSALSLKHFADNSLTYLYSSHLFEDFDTQEQHASLIEWTRVLHEKGLLILLLPDQQRYVKACFKKKEAPNEHHKISDFSPEYVENILHNIPQLQILKIYRFWETGEDEYNFLLLAQKY